MDDFGDTDLYLEHIEGDVDDDEDEGNTTIPFFNHIHVILLIRDS